MIIVTIIGKYLTGGKITEQGLTPRFKELSGAPVTAEMARMNFNDVFTGVWTLWGMYFSGFIAQLQVIGAAVDNASFG